MPHARAPSRTTRTVVYRGRRRVGRIASAGRGAAGWSLTAASVARASRPKKVTVAERYYGPDQLEQAAAWAQQQASIRRDVYWCIHGLLAKQRIKDNAASVATLWCDTDGVDLAGSRIKPTAVVQSSRGHFHNYARLTHPIAPHKAEEFNKRWALAFGADGSGFDLTQLLRVPGTRNVGYEDTPEVRLLSIDEETTAGREQVGDVPGERFSIRSVARGTC